MSYSKDSYQILQPKVTKLALLTPFWQFRDFIFVLVNLFKKNSQFISLELKLKLKQLHKINFDNCFFFNSGKSAIYFALIALGIKKGDKVIIPSFTCRAVLFALLEARVEPVLADIDENYNLNLENLLAQDLQNIKAIVIPNMFGKLNRNYHLIKEFQKRGIKVIEDNATSFGSFYNEEIISDAIVYSFNIGKIINGTGGGVVFTKKEVDLPTLIAPNKPKLKKTIINFCKMLILVRYRKFFSRFIRLIKRNNRNQISLSNYYSTKDRAILSNKNYFEFCQMSKINILFIYSQLMSFDALKRDYLDLSKKYFKSLNINNDFKKNELPNYMVYKFTDISRYDFGSYLSKEGIEVSWSYFPLHKIDIYRNTSIIGNLNVTNTIWKNFIYLPLHHFIKDADVDFISKSCKQYLMKNDK